MTQHHSREASDENKDTKSKKIDVSTTQVAGTALASVTAAFLGGQLGMAGTVGGAALTSVVITVGGEVYRRSLETTKEKAAVTAAKATMRRVGSRSVAGAEERTRRIDTSHYGGQELYWPGGERVADDRDAQRTRRIELPGRAESAAASTTVSEHPTPSRRRFRWTVIAVTSGLAFVLCMLVVTGFEGVTGRTLSGGEHGTTVGKLVRPGPRQDQPPVPAPEGSRTADTPEPSRRSSPTTGPAVEPSRERSTSERPTRERATEQPTPTRTRAPISESAPVEQPESTPSQQQGQQRTDTQRHGKQEERVVPSTNSGSGQ
ncbi:hypothetical protein FHX42_004044 [Saccharopolyspora lacisalsi]|uniref:Uncharacterized protein n=1 Tax=Halosaccharopolyspora lacisalsi TaxID=1000566 RepID=A0A839E4C7_9PSEU|nr:hypothetical protein [Halosaccharopolyspora lacisalsi]MBA8826665.1 hypothetical protein [Halosaccharopolyspora lacisalsi]